MATKEAMGTDSKTAQLIVMSYNYLIDDDIRSSLGLDKQITNSIIIFDEAHNIIEVCENS